MNSFKLLECKCACKVWEAASVVSTCLTDLLKRHQGGNKGWQRQTGHPYLGSRINDFPLPSLYPPIPSSFLHSFINLFSTCLPSDCFFLSFFPDFRPSTSSQPFPRTSATHYTTELIIERCLSVWWKGGLQRQSMHCPYLQIVASCTSSMSLLQHHNNQKKTQCRIKKHKPFSAQTHVYCFLSFVFCCRIICTQTFSKLCLFGWYSAGCKDTILLLNHAVAAEHRTAFAAQTLQSGGIRRKNVQQPAPL